MGDYLKDLGRVLSIFALLVSSFVLAQKAPAAHALEQPAAAALRAGFEQPPQSAKLRCYWWWLNGYTTSATIDRDLQGMKEKGYAGVILVDDYSPSSQPLPGGQPLPMGPDYGSPAFMKLYLHALKEAAGLGLQISLTITNGGNVGILGGPGVGPADALKQLTYSRTDVKGGGEQAIQLPEPARVGGYYQQIAVLAYPLRHGAALPGTPGSGRYAILDLRRKAAYDQTGDSMPDSANVFHVAPSIPGGQDTDLKDVVDLSSHVTPDDTLHWRFPAGEWEVLRIGYTASPSTSETAYGKGYALNVLSTAAFDGYWDRVVAPILDASKPYIGKSLRYLVTDSWEASGANWSGDFRAEFMRLRGYDPLPYLPVITGRIVQSRVASNNFLADLRRTVADLIVQNYYDHFAQRAAAYGLGTHPESGGPHGFPIDSLESFRSSAFPQTEFWTGSPAHRSLDEDRFFVKDAASAAHIYGKRYVAAESFSRIGPLWDVSPGLNIKPALDRALTEGVNRIFWHNFTSSPAEYGKPGIAYFADTHLNPNVTWWNQAGPVLLAMNRAQFLMQQGEPVVDLLYYYGTQVPDFARLKESDPARVLPGYDYDVTDEDALLHRMLGADGDLHTPEGIHYRALAIPLEQWLKVVDLVWMEKYVRAGGTVIGLRPLMPIGNVAPEQMAQFTRIATAMWGDCAPGSAIRSVRYGKGTIYCTQNARAAFAEMHVTPDLTWDGGGSNVRLDFAHRHTGDADIYFVRNVNDTAAKATLYFRVHGCVPELWNTDTGMITPAPLYREAGEQTAVPLAFPPHGSTFIVFQRRAGMHAVKAQRDGQPVYPSIESGMNTYASQEDYLYSTESGDYTIEFSNGTQKTLKITEPAASLRFEGNWTVAFPTGWGAPASITMPVLQSWTESSIPGVRYFSGTATYSRVLRVSDSALGVHRALWMDLGNVREIASVSINGRELRTLWHAPFLLRIDPALHAGSNTVSIAVTNLWPNRLIGDLQPGAHHYTQTNYRGYKRDSPLVPSGLLSPVKVYEADGERMAP
ncbi:MAG TPA: glycosyl hydrolase [Acidobacteriaceae bacterium]|nr:glycosyl hydrolase [Acidobacteriaceae bacterium]